ncbi:MAG: hypothetical protein AB7O98_17265 [Hyphomonadaceae bacterium]
MGNDATTSTSSDPLEQVLGRHTSSIAKEKAFITVLLGAVFADNKEHEAEAAEVGALLSRVKTLKSLPDEERRKAHQEVLHLVNGAENARNDHVKLACRSLVAIEKGNPPLVEPVVGLSHSVFAHACDIVFADMEVKPEERVFLRTVSEALEIPKDRADHIVRVIGLKNDY